MRLNLTALNFLRNAPIIVLSGGFRESSEQIQAAVGAHGVWKARLRTAIATGGADLSVDLVRNDHHCAFGSWLHGAEVSPAMMRSKHYQVCAELHCKFHLAAAEILSLAKAGKKQEANEALGAGRDFGRLSAELTRTMMAWMAVAGN